MAYTKNTWVTDDIITAPKLNNIESGLEFATNGLANTFTDFNTVASAMTTFVGNWKVTSNVVKNGPNGDTSYSHVSVSPVAGNGGYITVVPLSGIGMYIGTVSGGVITWSRLTKDTEAVKLTGDQTVAGNKSFTGNVSIAGSVMNYSTIPSISITGYVSGSLRVSKQSGMVSINSMDLVLAKGATFTLPAGYYPRAQLQAPITGQNSAGTTAGGYMTIGVDGSVKFDSMGFASGNATAYVNVHYFAQV